MRTAKINDHWNGISKKKFITQVRSITVKKLNNFQNETIDFYGPITALCGLNGLGKSTLLNSIYFLICNNEEKTNNNDIHKKFSFEEINGSIENDGSHINLTIKNDEENENNFDISLSWLDTSFQVPSLIKTFSKIDSLKYLLDAAEPAILNEDEVSHINYILGKRYLGIEYSEIELDQELLPYFKVQSESLDYEIQDMGNGEVSVLYIYWKLRNAPKNTIFLIEEPETFLSFPSQKKLMNILAYFSLKKGLTFILTTHSSAILSRIPIMDIKLFYENFSDKTIKLIDTRERRDYMSSLGLNPHKKGILLVEDRVSRILLDYMLTKRSQNFGLEYEIIDCGSESEIQTNLVAFPENISWLKVYGVFDGDQRKEEKKIMRKVKRDKFAFLPGNEPFEEQGQKLIYKYAKEIISRYSINEHNFYDTLKLIEGEDIHDWFMDVSSKLKIGFEDLIKSLFDLALKNDEKFKLEEEKSFEEIKRFLK